MVSVLVSSSPPPPPLPPLLHAASARGVKRATVAAVAHRRVLMLIRVLLVEWMWFRLIRSLVVEALRHHSPRFSRVSRGCLRRLRRAIIEALACDIRRSRGVAADAAPLP